MMQLYGRLALLLLLMGIGTVVVSGQTEPGGLYLAGKITTEQGKVDGTIIKMTRNGEPMNDYPVLPDGKFNLRFEFNNDYVLVFTRADNFPQKISISTTVPADVLRRDRKFPPFPVDVSLFQEIKGIDRTFSENAIMKIFYSASVDNFISEVYYNNAQIKKLIDQAVWQSQNVSREADLLKRLSAAELAELKKDYAELLKKAGSEFDRADYIAALGDYKAASRIFPSEQFPKDRIAEINDLIAVLGLQEELDRQMAAKYAQFIRQADLQFNTKDYESSKENYEQALTVRPDDQYASGRIGEIDKILVEREAQKKYGDLIALADNSFNEKLWDQARSRYLEATKIRPADPYPTVQIAKIDEQLNALALNAQKQSDFNAAVLNGDASYQKQFYSKALAFYETALTYKPGDPGVTAKIEKIQREQKQIADKLFYDESVANADKAYNKKEYPQARELYNAALAARPDQTYPARQIETIDRIMERFQEYDRLIASGDSFFVAQKYPEAREDFRVALNIKPGESYPEKRVKEIDAILANEAKADQQYRQLIAGADKFFNDRRFPQARTEYQKAISIRPSDSYPPGMIARIDALETEEKRVAEEKLAEQQRLEAEREAERQRLLAEREAEERARMEAELAEKERTYKMLIEEADKLAGNQALAEAVGKFREALQVKPQEQYPIQRISEIRGIITRQAETKKNFDNAIAQGDNAFREQKYTQAKDAYQLAQQLMAEENYPGLMLSKIDSIETENARVAAEKAAAAEAERLAKLAEEERIAAEKEAARLAKIAEEERLAAEKEAARLAKIAEEERIAAEKEAARLAKIAEEERIAAEKAAAAEAARLAKLAEEERIAAGKEAARLAQLAERDRLFNESVTKGDQYFTQKQYPEAIAQYQAALKTKPGESYPQQKISEGQRIIAEMAAARKAYDEAVAAADRAYRTKQYAPARESYRKAQTALPDEKYPPMMLARLDSVETEIARIETEKAAAAEAARLARLAEEERTAAAKKAEAERIAAEKEAARLAKIAEEERIAAEKAAAAEAARLAKVAEEERIAAEKAAAAEAARLAKIAEEERIAAEKEAARLAQESSFREKTEAGDRALAARNPDEAEKAYKEAQRIKPGDSYPAEQLKKVTELRTAILEEEKKSRDFARFIQQGDNAFQMKNYTMAATNYRNALAIKADDTWPAAQLNRIDSIRQAADRDDQYRKLLLAADGAYRVSNWSPARENYAKALELKPEESYPQKQIAVIDETLKRVEEQKNKPAVAEKPATPPAEPPVPVASSASATEEEALRDGLYASLIASADQSFDGKEYNVSRAWYYKALEIKPNEPYPTRRVDEINKILGSMQLSARDREFQQYIDQGDEAFRTGQWAIARSWYNRSLNIRPTDKYPVSQIAEIQFQINAQLQGSAEKMAADYVAQGDKALGSKQFNVARVWYQRALQLKPRDTDILSKLDELRKAQSAQSLPGG